MWKGTNLFSVRDKHLYNQLDQNSYDVQLILDTAILLSTLFIKDKLKNKLSDSVNFNENSKYIIIQLGLHKDPENKNKFVKGINLLEKKGFKVLLMPIGLAADHRIIRF